MAKHRRYKPKRPLKSSSLATWQRFEQKVKDFKKKEALIKRLMSY